MTYSATLQPIKSAPSELSDKSIWQRHSVSEVNEDYLLSRNEVLGRYAPPTSIETTVRIQVGDAIIVVEVPAEYRKWVEAIAGRLASLANNSSQWEQERSLQTSTVLNVFEFLFDTWYTQPPVPSVVPIPSGGIQLEWHTNGYDLEVEFTHDGAIEVYYHSRNEEKEFDYRQERSLVQKYLKEIAR